MSEDMFNFFHTFSLEDNNLGNLKHNISRVNYFSLTK